MLLLLFVSTLRQMRSTARPLTAYLLRRLWLLLSLLLRLVLLLCLLLCLIPQALSVGCSVMLKQVVLLVEVFQLLDRCFRQRTGKPAATDSTVFHLSYTASTCMHSAQNQLGQKFGNLETSKSVLNNME